MTTKRRQTPYPITTTKHVALLIPFTRRTITTEQLVLPITFTTANTKTMPLPLPTTAPTTKYTLNLAATLTIRKTQNTFRLTKPTEKTKTNQVMATNIIHSNSAYIIIGGGHGSGGLVKVGHSGGKIINFLNHSQVRQGKVLFKNTLLGKNNPVTFQIDTNKTDEK
jgi:hypothetical protein